MTLIGDILGFETIEERLKEKFPAIKIITYPDSIFIYKSYWEPIIVQMRPRADPWEVYQLGHECRTMDRFVSVSEAVAYASGLIRGL